MMQSTVPGSSRGSISRESPVRIISDHLFLSPRRSRQRLGVLPAAQLRCRERAVWICPLPGKPHHPFDKFRVDCFSNQGGIECPENSTGHFPVSSRLFRRDERPYGFVYLGCRRSWQGYYSRRNHRGIYRDSGTFPSQIRGSCCSSFFVAGCRSRQQ